jgi:hypothetical protein
VVVLAGSWLVGELTHAAEGQGVAVVDPRCFRLQTREEWMLPEWEELLGDTLARAGLFSARDDAAIDALAEEVRALPFVAEVGRAEIVWPDCLKLPIRMRSPVACVADMRTASYLPVAEDGTVLPGRSSAPHRAYGGWLPVIGPNDPAREPFAPGERLDAPEQLDALAVAITMWNELAPEARGSLGRVLIDASSPAAPDGLPGGVLLELEMRRRIVFGRAPGGPFPGELPHDVKWKSVARGLESLESGSSWGTYDVRWDAPVAVCRAPDAPTTLGIADTAPR